MKLIATTSLLLAGSTISAFGAFFTFENGVVNTENAISEPEFEWVYIGPPFEVQTYMFQAVIDDYLSSPLGPTGATANTQNGFDLFDPGGGGLDIQLFSWQFATGGNDLDLYTGPGSLTLPPTDDDPGAEDYRYDTQNNTAPHNLSFYYDGVPWASGYVTRFVVEVENRFDLDATGWGNAVVTDFVAAGEDFFNELMSLSNGTGWLFFEVDEFVPYSIFDPATFLSSGTVHVVPEPATWAGILGLAVLGLVLFVRLRRKGSLSTAGALRGD